MKLRTECGHIFSVFLPISKGDMFPFVAGSKGMWDVLGRAALAKLYEMEVLSAFQPINQTKFVVSHSIYHY